MTKKYVISEEELIELVNKGIDKYKKCIVYDHTIISDFLKSKKPIEIADLEDAIRDAIDENSGVNFGPTDDWNFLHQDNYDDVIKDAIQNIKDKGIELGG